MLRINKHILTVVALAITVAGSLALLFILTPYYMQTIATTPLLTHPIIYAAGLVLLTSIILASRLANKRVLSYVSLIILALFAITTIAGTALFAISSPDLPPTCNSWNAQDEPWNYPECHTSAVPTLHDVYVTLFENYPLAIVIALLAAVSIIVPLGRKK